MCSRKISAGSVQPKCVPSRAATSANAHQSARASPGAGRKARWRLIIRSLLVMVPLFSPHAKAGRRTWANAAVSVPASQSDTTTRSQLAKARRTASLLGNETAGLVAIIHTASTLLSAMAWNSSTAFKPGRLGKISVFQNAESLA